MYYIQINGYIRRTFPHLVISLPLLALFGPPFSGPFGSITMVPVVELQCYSTIGELFLGGTTGRARNGFTLTSM